MPAPTKDAALALDTPEKAVKTFFEAWKQEHWEFMFVSCQRTWKSNNPLTGAAFLVVWFGPKLLTTYGKPVLTARNGAVADFEVPVTYTLRDTAGGLSGPYEETILVKVISEAAPYEPKEGKGCYWGVNPLSALREKVQENAD